ncbi:MAG: hypothetical protein ABIO57_00420 [Candidatus Paceibacterota bacterium]
MKTLTKLFFLLTIVVSVSAIATPAKAQQSSKSEVAKKDTFTFPYVAVSIATGKHVLIIPQQPNFTNAFIIQSTTGERLISIDGGVQYDILYNGAMTTWRKDGNKTAREITIVTRRSDTNILATN